jgi:hypothetical protein
MRQCEQGSTSVEPRLSVIGVKRLSTEQGTVEECHGTRHFEESWFPKLWQLEPHLRLIAGELAVQPHVGVNPTSNWGKDRIRPVERSDSSPSRKASFGIDVR